MALPHLEEMARRYAIAAVNADRSGDVDRAIANYKKAIDVLAKIVKLYPDSPFTSIYLKMMREYEARLKELRSVALAADQGPPAYGDGAKDADELVLTERPNISFSDIADLEHAKQAIKEAIIYPVKRPDLFPLGWPRGILLFGPPGCGKTMLASAVANEVRGVFFYVDAAGIMSKWLGEAEKNVARLFKKAREYASRGVPAIIFIDEIDALFGVYSSEVGGEVRVRNQFLKEMDGIQDKGSNLHVYVIGATNKPWRLDEPFIRRFQKRVYIPLPDYEARVKLFEMYIRGLSRAKDVRFSGDIDVAELARLTEGYTASDIRDIVQAVHSRVITEYFEATGGDPRYKPRPITMEDFRDVIRRRKPSVNEEMIKAYEAWYERFRAV